MKKLLFLVVLILLTWAFGFAAFTASVLAMRPQEPLEKTDAIVVLTGGKSRIETGLALFSEQAAPELFITGVHENVSKEELMNRHIGKSLPECCITVGYQARTTTGNADEAAQWVRDRKFKSIRLVTSNYHMPRALLEFRRAMPGTAIIPNPVAQEEITPTDHYFWIITFEEYHKTAFKFSEMAYRYLQQRFL